MPDSTKSLSTSLDRLSPTMLRTLLLTALRHNDLHLLHALRTTPKGNKLIGKKHQALYQQDMQITICQQANPAMLNYLAQNKVILQSDSPLDSSGNRCAHLAASYGNLEMLAHLPKECLNQQNYSGDTPLHCLLKKSPRRITQGIQQLAPLTDMTLLDSHFNEPHNVDLSHLNNFGRLAQLLESAYRRQTIQ